MSRLEQLKNEALNLNTNARKALLVELLRAEEKRTLDSMLPLEADHQEYIRQEKRERESAAALAAGCAVGLLTLGVLALVHSKHAIESKARLLEEKLDQDRKETIRTLSRIKGRH